MTANRFITRIWAWAWMTLRSRGRSIKPLVNAIWESDSPYGGSPCGSEKSWIERNEQSNVTGWFTALQFAPIARHPRQVHRTSLGSRDQRYRLAPPAALQPVGQAGAWRTDGDAPYAHRGSHVESNGTRPGRPNPGTRLRRRLGMPADGASSRGRILGCRHRYFQ